MAFDPGRSTDPYDLMARYYDAGMGEFDDDLALYMGFAERCRGPILELGCGTGRLLEPLSAAGFEVVGIDRSEAMLERARSRLAGRESASTLIRGSLCQPPLRCNFGVVILAIDTFLHLQTQSDQIACLKAARRLLDEGGLLIIDIPSPAASGWEDWTPGVHPFVPVWSTCLEDGTRVDKLSSFSADPTAQTHDVTEFYDCVAPDGSLRRTTVEYALRFVFPAELDLLCASAGLKIVNRYGDYELASFVAGSERQICVAAVEPLQSADDRRKAC